MGHHQRCHAAHRHRPHLHRVAYPQEEEGRGEGGSGLHDKVRMILVYFIYS